MDAVISRTELARNTREIVEQVRHGQTVIVQSYGEEQIVLLDALDYRLLRAAAAYSLDSPHLHADDAPNAVVWQYLDQQISLAKAAELLECSRFELMARFERLGLPLRLGSASLDEAKDEVAAASRGKTPAK